MKRIYLFIIILIFLIGIVGGVYYFINKLMGNDNDVVNKEYGVFYVSAKDYLSGDLKEVNFVGVKNGEVIYEGKTSDMGLKEIKIERDEGMLYFLNYGGEYYVNKVVIGGGNNVEFELHKIGFLNVSLVNSSNSYYNLKVSPIAGQFRQMGFCVKFSYNYLNINSEFLSIQQPTRFEDKYDKCFYTKHSLDYDDEMIIKLDYEVLNNLEEDDYIKLIFFDSDRSFENKYIVENREGENIGGDDFEFIIK